MKKFIAAIALVCICLGSAGISIGQTKKNGSKDMRFKKNKQPLKKDGTPDKRYTASKK